MHGANKDGMLTFLTYTQNVHCIGTHTRIIRRTPLPKTNRTPLPKTNRPTPFLERRKEKKRKTLT